MPANNQKLIQIPKKIFSYFAVAVLVFTTFEILLSQQQVSAAQITGRKLTLSTSSAASSAATTTYTFNFTVPSSTVLQSFEAVVCTTASGTCTTPTGFSVSSSTLSSQPTNLGDASGWTVSTATAGKLRIKKTGNSAAPTGAQTVVFGSVQNPTTANSTFFARLNTYSDDAWTTGVDSGVVAASTAAQISVTASVDESLSLCVYSGANCGAGGTSVALGTLSSSTITTGAHKVEAGTNANSGYVLQYNGATLTDSGISQTISAIGGTAAASSTGSEQFGFNAGTYSGGSGAPGAQYDSGSEYAFAAGSATTFATASGPSATTTYTLTYGANISTGTEAGSYSTTITYICTATF